MNKTFCFLACSLMAALAALPALAQTNSAFATSLKPGDRVTVDIAGYKYQAVFKKYSECRNGDGKCGTITDDDGNTKDVLIRYFNPPAAGAAKAAAANKGTLPTGKFNCFFFSGYLQSIPGFTLAPGGKFTDHVGTGKYTWDAATGIISFTGGAWNGQKVKTDSQGGLGVLKKDGSVGAVSCSRA